MDNAEEYWITARCIMRLDGAPVFEPEVFRNQIYCTEVLVTLLGLFGAPQSFRALIVIWPPENWGPCPPSLRPWLLHAETHLNKSWYTALTRGRREPWALGGAKFSIRRIFAPLWGNTNRIILQGDGSVSKTCPKTIGKFYLNFIILSESPPHFVRL